MTTEFSQPGHRYQLTLRGQCRPLTEPLPGGAAIETGPGGTSLTFSAQDSDLYGLLDRIQDLGLHLITLNEIGTQAVPHLPLRASPPHPGASP